MGDYGEDYGDYGGDEGGGDYGGGDYGGDDYGGGDYGGGDYGGGDYGGGDYGGGDYGGDGDYEGGDYEGGAAGGADDPMVEVENNLVEGEDLMSSDPAAALEKFELVVSKEEELQPEVVTHRFAALRFMLKVCASLSNTDKMVECYSKMLGLLDKVTANDGNAAITEAIDEVAVKMGGDVQARIYEMTLDILRGSNQAQWFKVLLKLAESYVKADQPAKLMRAIEQLHESLRTAAGDDDPTKSTQLLQVYALRIQHCGLIRDYDDIHDLYKKVQAIVAAAVADPKIMGIIHETFGNMHMSHENWTEAYKEYFDAFTSYQNAGSSRAVACLKYVLLANMVAGMSLNPFDSQEAKAYKSHKEIDAMVQLRTAYEKEHIGNFERVLHDPENHIETDPLIREYLAPLLENFRSQLILSMVAAYSTLRMRYIAKRLNIDEEEVERLLVSLVLDRRLDAQIDQVNGVLRLGAKTAAANKLYSAVETATGTIQRIRDSQQATFN